MTVTPGADADTFDLVATWQKTATAIAASEMATQFGYVLNVTAPPGRALGVPAAGTVTLSGRTNPGPAGRASAVVFTAS